MNQKIINLTQDTVIAKNVVIADTIFKRLRGLLGKNSLMPGEGLLIVPCNAIHSCFMRFSFDAVFLDKEDMVVHLITNMRPFCCSPIIHQAVSVLELPAGTVWATGTQLGDRIIRTTRKTPAFRHGELSKSRGKN